jgi:hypothetical protein
MGIQHKSLPFAAVQFHPESILTSPSHGMTIIKNSLRFLTEEKSAMSKTQGTVIEDLDCLSVAELKEQLKNANIGSSGSKSDLIVKLTLLAQKRDEAKNGLLSLDSMTVSELRELKHGLGVKGTAGNKSELLSVLKESLGV